MDLTLHFYVYIILFTLMLESKYLSIFSGKRVSTIKTTVLLWKEFFLVNLLHCLIYLPWQIIFTE